MCQSVSLFCFPHFLLSLHSFELFYFYSFRTSDIHILFFHPCLHCVLASGLCLNMFSVHHPFPKILHHLRIRWRLSLSGFPARLMSTIFLVSWELSIVFLVLLIEGISEFIALGWFSRIHVLRCYFFNHFFSIPPFRPSDDPFMYVCWHCSTDLECPLSWTLNYFSFFFFWYLYVSLDSLFLLVLICQSYPCLYSFCC